MKVDGRWRRTIELAPDGRSVIVLDQAVLPYAIAWMQLATVRDVEIAIRDMHIRGAPLIGVTAAYGVAIAMHADPTSLDAAIATLAATRPTAINLRWALDLAHARLAPLRPADRAQAAFALAAKLADDDVAACEAIGALGADVIAKLHRDRPVNVLTHCNAGWVATVDWGTVTAPIFMAHEMGIPVHVWVDETRPRNQGLLTAWELASHGVPHTLVVDNAGGHLMQHKKVDLVMVGADRVTRRGDVCNKIGTYLKALAARDNGVPFYACVPSPTIDWTIEDGVEEIPIEERDPEEVRNVRGLDADGKFTSVAIATAGTPVANPAFDVTPHDLVTGIITEKGIARASERELLKFWPRDQRSKAYLT